MAFVFSITTKQLKYLKEVLSNEIKTNNSLIGNEILKQLIAQESLNEATRKNMGEPWYMMPSSQDYQTKSASDYARKKEKETMKAVKNFKKEAKVVPNEKFDEELLKEDP